MKKEAKELFYLEIKSYRKKRSEGNFEKSYHHLSRAHIISQLSVFYHLYVHLIMFEFALKRKNIREVFGQLLRLLVTIPGHLSGRIPYGNTGWSDMPLTKELPCPEDLKFLF